MRIFRLQDSLCSNGLGHGLGLCKVVAKCVGDRLHRGYITVYLHSLQSRASCRLRERAIRSNRASQLQCQLPLVTAPGSGGQIKSQFVFETGEPGCLLRAAHLINGLCSFLTPSKRRTVGAWFIPTLHNSVLNSPTEDKQKQSRPGNLSSRLGLWNDVHTVESSDCFRPAGYVKTRFILSSDRVVSVLKTRQDELTLQEKHLLSLPNKIKQAKTCKTHGRLQMFHRSDL